MGGAQDQSTPTDRISASQRDLTELSHRFPYMRAQQEVRNVEGGPHPTMGPSSLHTWERYISAVSEAPGLGCFVTAAPAGPDGWPGPTGLRQMLLTVPARPERPS